MMRRLREVAMDRKATVPARRGAAMIFAMMALLLGSMMMASLVRTASASHRQMKREEIRVQANLLADAGCRRAIAELQSNPQFAGEDWQVPGELLGQRRGASVVINVKRAVSPQEGSTVTVVASYPVGHPDLVKTSRELALP